MNKNKRLLKLMADDAGLTVEKMIEEAVTDSVVPAICLRCEEITEMEPDQTEGYCESCERNAVVSCLILAELI